MRLKLLSFTLLLIGLVAHPVPAQASSWWQVQSIDTMKFSRDPSRQALTDSSFKDVIDGQTKDIAGTGANYIAIATPYDSEFLPVLKAWVASARKYHLHVWFRGNWSGWEGWFGYSSLSPSDHFFMTQKFILANPDLFQDGDIFTPCPECENGGPGDPRRTGKVEEFRQFMINEYNMTKDAFTSIHKKVATNYASMNLDVAKLVMDTKTTQAMDGLIVVDHYVKDPKVLAADLESLSSSAQSEIVLGEFGAPIPDLHGSMSPQDQSVWLSQVLSELVKAPHVVGVNYWTSFGGSTQIWGDIDSPFPAVNILSSYYFPKTAHGLVADVFGQPIPNAKVSSSLRVASTDRSGTFQLPYLDPADPLTISAPGYISQGYTYYSSEKNAEVYLRPLHEGVLYRLKILTYRLFGVKIHA